MIAPKGVAALSPLVECPQCLCVVPTFVVAGRLHFVRHRNFERNSCSNGTAPVPVVVEPVAVQVPLFGDLAEVTP